MVKFKCGCEIDPNNLHPYHIRLDCPDTFNMLCLGKTKGVWQLESNLGKTYTQKLQPRCVEDLSALVALLRPAVLEAYDENGVNMVQKYCNRKNHMEETTYLHPSLEPILKDNYGVICYQELAMKICQDLAGFTESEADMLRKAMGKKLPEEMAKVKTMFLEKVASIGILDKYSAEQLFEQIQASQRYSFNKCVSKNTILRKASTGKYDVNLSIEEMYNIKNNIEYAKKTGHLSLYKKWKRIGNYGKGLSMCEDGRVRPNIIVDIQKAGQKTIYRITLSNNSYIDVTSNHKFPTPNGQKRCDELCVGDCLYSVLPYEKNTDKYNWSNISIPELRQLSQNKNHDHQTVGFMTGYNNPGYVNGEYTKWDKNIKLLPDQCEICGISNVRLEVHHKDGNRQHNDLDNLQKLCVSHHKKAEYALGRVKRGEKGYPTTQLQIISIEKLDQVETYDITMGAPNHNFVTNQNIVTCNSHSALYGTYSYITAYFKQHFTLEFFCSYLSFASEKIDPAEEKHQLVNEAKLFDIQILPPDLRWQQANFHIKDDKIYFGLGNVKGVGLSKVKKLLNLCKDMPISELNWFNLLLNILDGVDTTTVEHLILVGAFDYLGMPRIKMYYEYGIWKRLTEKEQIWVKTAGTADNLIDSLREAARSKKEGGACANVNRIAELQDLIKILENPPFALRDSSGKIAIDEQRLLGISLTAHETDAGAGEATCSCKEFLAGYTGDIKLAVTITRLKEHTTKRGNNPGQLMAFLTVEDISCALDSVLVFPEDYQQNKALLVENNTVLLYGNRSKENSFIIKKAVQI